MSDRKIAFWFIALLSVLVLVPFLGETIFYSKGEPREAIVAYTMLESGNWILPMNYGVEIAYKPPFLYWTIAVISSVLGESRSFRHVCRRRSLFWLCSWFSLVSLPNVRT